MRRFLLYALLAVVTLLAVTAGSLAFLAGHEPLLKSQLGKLVRQQTGRELHIAGPLRVDLGRLTTLSADKITLSDAGWADSPYMARIGRLEIRLDLPSLFNRPAIAIPYLELDDCDINLLENDQGQANWDLLQGQQREAPAPVDEAPGLPLRFTELLVSDCRMTLESPRRARPLEVEASRIALEHHSGSKVSVAAAGSVNQDPVTINGWVDPVRAFLQGGRVDHELHVVYGAVSLHSSGSVADAKSFSALDIKTRFQGPAIENVLDVFSLPHFSTGDFDIRLGIDSDGGMNRIDVDGDLGSVNLVANGRMDRLLRPSSGEMRGTLSGPDLRSLGQALGVDGLPDAPFSLASHSRFEGVLAHLADTVLEAGADRLELSGHVGLSSGMPGSMLDFRILSEEIGHWMPLAGQPETVLGPLDLRGTLATNDAGLARIDASAVFQGAQLSATGPIGPLAGPLTPRLQVEVSTANARPLLALAGRPGFPEVPAELSSALRLEGERLYISGLKLDLAGHKATVDGYLNLEDHVSGSALEVTLDSGNLESLGRLFGRTDLPPQALSVNGTLRPQGRGLRFTVDDSSLGDIRLKLDGAIADLEKPLGVDATFDVRLPELAILAAALPDFPWPPGPFEASGALHNEQQLTRLSGVRLALGDVRAEISGQLMHDRNFDLQIKASGPDAAVFHESLRQDSGAFPFSLQTGLAGNPQRFRLDDLDLELGQSNIAGNLEFGLGERTTIAGRLQSGNLDLRPWKTAQVSEKADAAEANSRFVFDDTPVLWIDDYGLDIDAEIRVESADLGNTQLQDIDLAVDLKKNVLELKRFSLAGKGGGRLSGTAKLDGRQGAPQLDVDIQARELRTGLGSGVDQDASTWPRGDFDIRLSGSGNTQREMARSLNGRVHVAYGAGLVAIEMYEFLTSDFLTELLDMLNPFSRNNRFTELECLVVAAEVSDGRVAVQPVVFRTRQVTVLSQGEIDLHTENINLSFNSVPRRGLGLSASTLINPFIRVGGRLIRPVIELDPANTVVRGGLAVATAGISILAKSMSDRFLGSNDPCGEALKAIEAGGQDAR